jgi:DNA recombination protein RmuC
MFMALVPADVLLAGVIPADAVLADVGLTDGVLADVGLADVGLAALIGILVLVAAVTAGIALARRRTGPALDPEVVSAAVVAALSDARQHVGTDRDEAIRTAIATATQLQSQQVGSLLDAARRDLDAAVQRNADAIDAAVQRNAASLDARHGLIDSHLGHVEQALQGRLGELAALMGQLKHSTAESFGTVSAQLRSHAEITRSLSDTTDGLRQALANTNTRGQWGERMADDLLRRAGMEEGINYIKQKSAGDGSGIPDVTFLLPNGHRLHMDVKFPMSAYLRHLEATTDAERAGHLGDFLRDVRQRVRELARRSYGSGDSRALDYVLLFVPNESIAGVVHQHDTALLDDALAQNVVMCSPLNLYSLLAVIRQAVDAFAVERQADQILEAMGAFSNQWGKFSGCMDTLGRRLESTQKAFDDMSGTRLRVLQRALDRVEELRIERGIGTGLPGPVAGTADPDAAPGADVVDLAGSRRELGA